MFLNLFLVSNFVCIESWDTYVRPTLLQKPAPINVQLFLANKEELGLNPWPIYPKALPFPTLQKHLRLENWHLKTDPKVAAYEIWT